MWYNNKFRRHLCDMHIDDWNDEFLSDFSPEKYYENLKTAKIQNAMIYFQSHVGLCYYPTKSGKMHRALTGREDAVKRLTQMCRQSGIAVTGYYSLIFNNWAYNEHPEWRIVSDDIEFAQSENNNDKKKKDQSFSSAKPGRYGLCCPNNPEYRKFISAQIKEICEYFEFDGMFFDMLFWPKLCRCKSCLSRFKNETGYELPKTENWNDPIWLLHIEKRREWMGQFAQSVTDELKSYVPDTSVEHNSAYAVLPSGKTALGEGVLNACDYAGGDLYGNSYHQSFTCKFYRNISKNQPFEYMLSRCEPNLSKHTITKSEDTLSSQVFLTAAHHGATLAIDAIDPIGTLDNRVYKRLGKVFSKEMKYEKYFYGDMIEDVGIYYTLRSKFNAHGEPYSNHMGSVNCTKLMIENNICCGVTGGYHDINKYKLLIASCLTGEDKYDCNRICDYVKSGGNLYISGGDCAGLLKEFFNGEIVGRTSESVVYIAPNGSPEVQTPFGWFNENYPLHFDGSAPIATGLNDEKVIATLTLPYTLQDTDKFASIHSNPPGIKTNIPTMAFTKYGKGKVLWSALPIESIEKPYQYGDLFIKLLREFLNFEQTIDSSAPKDVEIIAFESENEMTISAVQLCGDLYANPVAPFSICIKTNKRPKRIVCLPDEIEHSFEYKDGYINFKVDDLKIFDMKKIIF